MFERHENQKREDPHLTASWAAAEHDDGARCPRLRFEKSAGHHALSKQREAELTIATAPRPLAAHSLRSSTQIRKSKFKDDQIRGAWKVIGRRKNLSKTNTGNEAVFGAEIEPSKSSRDRLLGLAIKRIEQARHMHNSS